MSNNVMIIGIAGGTGSGKSTFTNRLRDAFPDDVAVLYHDNYYKCQDDWMDERKPVKQIYKKMISSSYLKIKEEYPKKIKVIEENLQKINAYEKENYDHIDDLAGCFGRVMGEICTYQDDIFYDDLYEMGFYLGKFIYLLDAYDDIEEDIKKRHLILL